MSLTSYIRRKKVRKKIDELCDKPAFDLDFEIIAPLKAENPRLIGVAFDYLMRFWLKYKNPHAQTSKWVAKTGAESFAVSPEERKKEMWEEGMGKRGKAVSKVLNAEKKYKEFLNDGKLTRELLKSVLDLAKLDSIIRARIYPKNLDEYKENNIEDLKNLYNVIPKEKFISKEEILLNPTFGKASRLVGGADADLVFNNVLLDIKTTKEIKLQLSYWRQLVGYAVLADMKPSFPDLESVGIYFSRFGKLWTQKITTIYDAEGYSKFKSWFKNNALKLQKG